MKFNTHLCLPETYPCTKFGPLSTILYVCKSSIVSLLVASVFRCWNVIHYILLRKFIIQLLNSGLKNARKIIRILYFLSNAVIGNKFAKFQCFDEERSPTACFSHSIKTKYVRNEEKKEKLEILYQYSEKCVNSFPQASSFFIRACFHGKKLNTESLELLG